MVHAVVTPTNRQVARLFATMADLLGGRPSNPHRIRAYRRAAETIAGCQEDLRTLAERGALQTLPGIGRELSLKIEEFLRTGTIRSYEELKRPLPAGVREWADLPGLSEELVQLLYIKLRIRTLDDLETLVRSHLLRTLSGAAVAEEPLLEAIRARRALP